MAHCSGETGPAKLPCSTVLFTAKQRASVWASFAAPLLSEDARNIWAQHT